MAFSPELAELVASRGIQGMKVIDMFASVSSGNDSVPVEHRAGFGEFVNALVNADGFDIFIDTGQPNTGGAFPKVEVVANDHLGGIGALPRSIQRQQVTPEQLNSTADTALRSLTSVIQLHDAARTLLEEAPPTHYGRGSIGAAPGTLREALRNRFGKGDKGDKGGAAATAASTPAGLQIRVEPEGDDADADAASSSMAGPAALGFSSGRTTPKLEPFSAHGSVASSGTTSPSTTRTGSPVKMEPHLTHQPFRPFDQQPVFIVLASQQTRDRLLWPQFEAEASNPKLPPCHRALLEFVGWSGPTGVRMSTIQASFDIRPGQQIKDDLFRLVADGYLCRMSHWDVATKKKRELFDNYFYLAKYHVEPEDVPEPTGEGGVAAPEELEFGAGAADADGDDGEGKPGRKGKRHWKGWTTGTANGAGDSVTVQLKHISPETFCNELGTRVDKTATVSAVMETLTGQRGSWGYKEMMDALVERRILRVFYKQLLATDRQGIAKEGVFKEKQCVTLLRPYTECLFSAVVDKTLEHQAKLYAKANGATGFCYGELQIRFGLSRRSARTLMLPLAQAGHLGSLEGVHQVSWDATTIFVSAEHLPEISVEATAVVSIKEMTKRRENAMTELIVTHKVLELGIETRRLLQKAEIVAAGNETPKLTDTKVLTRLLKKFETEGKASQIQRTVKPSEDEKTFVKVKLILAPGIDPDGAEVAAECAKIVTRLQEKIAKRLKPVKPDKGEKKIIRRVPKKKRNGDGPAVSSLDAFLANDDDAAAAAAADAGMGIEDLAADALSQLLQRPAKRRKGDAAQPWEENQLEYSIMAVMWLKERDGDFSELISASIDQIEDTYAPETILVVLGSYHKDGWLAKRRNFAYGSVSSFRLSESFLRNVRLKIPSTLISQAQGLANKLHEVPIKVNYKNDTNMAPAAVVALHGLQAGCITAAIELAAPTNDTQPATGDGMELTGKADDEDPTMTSTSSKAYLASGDLDSLTAKGTRQFFAERLLSVTLSSADDSSGAAADESSTEVIPSTDSDAVDLEHGAEMQRLKAALSRQQAAADKDTDQDTDKDKDIAESVHDGAIPDTEVERLSKLIEALGPPRDQLLAVIEAAGISGLTEFALYTAYHGGDLSARPVGGSENGFRACLDQLLVDMKVCCFGSGDPKFISPEAIRKAYGNEPWPTSINDLGSTMAPFLNFLAPPIVRSWAMANKEINGDLVKLMRARVKERVVLSPGISLADLTEGMRLLAAASDITLIVVDYLDKGVLVARVSLETRCADIFGTPTTYLCTNLFPGTKTVLTE